MSSERERGNSRCFGVASLDPACDHVALDEGMSSSSHGLEGRDAHRAAEHSGEGTPLEVSVISRGEEIRTESVSRTPQRNAP